MLFGNDEGFLNDDGTPLHHDIFNQYQVGVGNLVDTPQGGTSMDQPLYPLSFDGALAQDTLDWLHVPPPERPSITGLSYEGALGDNVSFGGLGGTFFVTTSGRGTGMIVISSEKKGTNCDVPITEADLNYWDPTNPCNSVLYVDVDQSVVDQPAPWYGRDNKGDPFPVGTNFPVKATLRGGEYHMPMIDLEGAIWGSRRSPSRTRRTAPVRPSSGSTT